MAVFLAAGIQNYAMDQVKNVTWADEQAKASWALKWNETYQPAARSGLRGRFATSWSTSSAWACTGPVTPPKRNPAPMPPTKTVVRTASRPAEGEGERPASESASSGHPSTSNSPPPAEAGSKRRGKTRAESRRKWKSLRSTTRTDVDLNPRPGQTSGEVAHRCGGLLNDAPIAGTHLCRSCP